MWAKIVLILGGLTGIFVSEIFDTGVLTLGASIVVLVIGIFSSRSGDLTELAMEVMFPGRKRASRKKEKGAREDDDA